MNDHAMHSLRAPPHPLQTHGGRAGEPGDVSMLGAVGSNTKASANLGDTVFVDDERHDDDAPAVRLRVQNPVHRLTGAKSLMEEPVGNAWLLQPKVPWKVPLRGWDIVEPSVYLVAC